MHSPTRPLRILALAALCAATAAARAVSPAQLADVDAKAEYAFFTEDARALARLLAANAALAGSAQALERYQYAHAQFRRLQVAYRERKPKEVESAASACITALDEVSDADPRNAEALALEAACAAYLGSLGGLRGMTAQHKSELRLAAALKQAPRNPRVLLVDGLARWFRAGQGPAERAQAAKSFEAAARAFENVTANEPGQPSWGEAEAWLFVGRAHEEAGDLLAARNAYEKSLLIAPEFAAARRRIAALRAQR